jgi:hypothetical protein
LPARGFNTGDGSAEVLDFPAENAAVHCPTGFFAISAA